MKIQIERQLTKPQYAKITAAIFFNSWAFRAWVIFSLALGVSIFFLYGRTSLSLAAAAAAFLLVMIVVILAPALKLMANIRSPKNSRFFLPSILIFDESGMSASSSLGEGKTKWKSMIGWREVAGCYLIYLSKTGFVAIPRSAIAPRDILNFESLLMDNVKRLK